MDLMRKSTVTPEEPAELAKIPGNESVVVPRSARPARAAGPVTAWRWRTWTHGCARSRARGRRCAVCERFDHFCQRHPSVALTIFALCALASMVVA